MKKRIFSFLLLFTIILSCVPYTTYAAAIGDTQNGTPTQPTTTPETTPDSGDNSDDTEEGDEEEEETPVILGPQILSFSPNVTSLHSINAFLAANPEAAPTGVYFLPYLEDFPVNLADTAAHVVDTGGTVHNFAAVYTGAFNTEVAYYSALTDTENTGRLITSKKVYDSTDNSRALTLMGYDLLLSNELCDITTKDNVVSVSYQPELVGKNPMRAETIVMDIYKALQQYEWDMEFVWCIDNSLTLDTNPIQEQISVQVNDTLEKGIDTSEGATWVWATRSNPELYWDKVDKDCVFNGGAHNATTNATNIEGTKTSVSFNKTRTATMTMGEFCAVAHAMMELYGEPVLTETETLLMLQNYTLDLPTGASEEITDAIEYLAAKGIIHPSEIDLDKAVTFADIENILCRIADEDSRLTFKNVGYNFNSELVQKGYVEVETSLDGDILTDLEEITNPLANAFNDYFVEADDKLTNLLITEDGGVTTKLIATDMLCNDSDSEELFINNGITPTGYYHFQIHSSISSAVISYLLDDNATVVSGGSYTLTGGGGVYNVNNEGEFEHFTFDEAMYSDLYIDADRRTSGSMWQGEAPLSDSYHWYSICIQNPDEQQLKNSISAITYDGVPMSHLFSLVPETEPLADYTYDIAVWRCADTVSANGDTVAQYVLQTKDSNSEFMSKFTINSSTTSTKHSSNAYYNKNGELLVSYDFLKEKGLVNSMTEINDGTYLIVGGVGAQSKSNIYLFTKTDKILVNNTLYDSEGSDLVLKVSATTYINYRACLGWTCAVMTINSNGTIIPYTKLNFSNLDLTWSTKSIQTAYPRSIIVTDYLNWDSKSSTDYEGFSMSTAYPLSNYIVVVGEHISSLDDSAFIWYRRKVNVAGSIMDLGDDSVARQKFEYLTGISLSGVSSDFYLRYVPLDRNNAVGGFRNLKVYSKTYNDTKPVLDLGYIYQPAEFNDITNAYKAYFDTGSLECLLPIVKLNDKYFNINMNTCSKNSTSTLLAYGSLPYRFQTSNPKDNNKIGTLQNNGNVTVSSTADLSTAQIYPAPVGIFQTVIGLPLKSSSTVFAEGSPVYYGSCKAKLYDSGNTLTVGGLVVSSGSATNLISLYTGMKSQSAYAYPCIDMGVNTEIEVAGVSDVIQTVISSDVTIDWEKYTFKRLIEVTDRWSTVLLIFALNILPRVGMLIFFVLMILSLIADVRVWIVFNERVIDVYKILTLGRQNVHTIDFKRTFVSSLLCFSLFLMFLDGLLFNVIIWCSKVFIYLYQH